MIREYCSIDEQGNINGRYRLEENDSHIGFGKLIEAPSNTLIYPRYDSTKGVWVEDCTREKVLSKLKDSKKNELRGDCGNSILNGFKVVLGKDEYHFSYDREAQMNLQERWQLFQNNMIDEITVTAHLDNEDVRLAVDKDIFGKIYMQSVMAKENKIKKLREDLFPLVERAKSQTELDVIKWDMEVIEPKPESIVLKDDKTLDKELDRVESDSAVANNEIISLIMLTNMMGGMG